MEMDHLIISLVAIGIFGALLKVILVLGGLSTKVGDVYKVTNSNYTIQHDELMALRAEVEALKEQIVHLHKG